MPIPRVKLLETFQEKITAAHNRGTTCHWSAFDDPRSPSDGPCDCPAHLNPPGACISHEGVRCASTSAVLAQAVPSAYKEVLQETQQDLNDLIGELNNIEAQVKDAANGSPGPLQNKLRRLASSWRTTLFERMVKRQYRRAPGFSGISGDFKDCQCLINKKARLRNGSQLTQKESKLLDALYLNFESINEKLNSPVPTTAEILKIVSSSIAVGIAAAGIEFVEVLALAPELVSAYTELVFDKDIAIPLFGLTMFAYGILQEQGDLVCELIYLEKQRLALTCLRSPTSQYEIKSLDSI